MVATLLRLVGIDVKRLARETAITIVLAMLGAFAAMLALTFSFAALYLWLELKLGIFAALGILGGTSALLACVLFAVAFLRCIAQAACPCRRRVAGGGRSGASIDRGHRAGGR